MEIQNYGATLREIRKQKGYSMQQLAAGISSISFLSKFERGESDISLSYFSQMLERLSVSYDEFFYVHQNDRQDHFEQFFDQADLAYVQRDLTQLKRLKKRELDKWKMYGIETFRCNTFMINVYERILSNKRSDEDKGDLSILYNYLFNVEVWGYYELRLYNSTMLLMPPAMVITLSKIAYKKRTRYRKLKKINDVMTPILLNTLNYLIGGPRPKQYIEEYNIFLSYLESLNIHENDLKTRTSLLQIKGIHEIKVGEREEGIAMVNKAISIFSELGSEGLAAEARNYLNIVLNES